MEQIVEIAPAVQEPGTESGAADLQPSYDEMVPAVQTYLRDCGKSLRQVALELGIDNRHLGFLVKGERLRYPTVMKAVMALHERMAASAEMPDSEREFFAGCEALILDRPAQGDWTMDPVEFWRKIYEEGRLTLSEVGKANNLDTSVVSKVLAGKYAGDQVRLRRDMNEGRGRWLTSSGGAHIRTGASVLIERVIEAATGSEFISVIAGDPGLGKTDTLRRLARRKDGRKLMVITLDQMSTSATALQILAAALGIKDKVKGTQLVRLIIRGILQERVCVIWDETNTIAGRPRQAAEFMNTMRQINDETEQGMVFMGTRSMSDCLKAEENKDLMEMIQSRIQSDVTIPATRIEELKAFFLAHFTRVQPAAFREFQVAMQRFGELSLRRAAVFLRQAKSAAAIEQVSSDVLTNELARAALARMNIKLLG